MTDWTPDRVARACLSAVVDVGNAELARTVAQHGPEHVWHTLRDGTGEGAWSRRARTFELEAALALVRGHDLRFLVPGDPGWWPGWDDLDQVDHQGMGGAPLGVWCLGRADLAPATALAGAAAVVGSRASSAYGDRVGSDLGAELGAAGVTVLSGGAYGVDAAAHRGALAADGLTVAVLAGGLDAFYPRGNQRLLEQVADQGLVLSEVAPGQTPTKAGFLARNRLIAAGAAGVVLVEAVHRSGALNTVAWAKHLQRLVMAVPGSIYSATSLGPHAQIASGEAVLVGGADEVRRLLGPLAADPAAGPAQPRLLDGLVGDQLAAREALPGRGGAEVATVAERAGLSYPACLAALAQLEALGLARRRPDGTWSLDRPR